MEEFILTNSSYFRMGIFSGLFLIFSLWEVFFPDHKSAVGRKDRWFSNITLVFLNNIILRIVFPVTAIGIAEYAHRSKLGFLNIRDIDPVLAIILAIIFMDFIIYVQHVIFHAIPALWRLHSMHHADLELDVTSGTRFHPVEIMISMFIKWAAIILSGASPFSVLIFEVVLNAMAMFNHSNIKIPETADKYLRYLIVTPAMHRIHHSVLISEYNTNYGFNLSIWDRMMGTLRDSYTGQLTLGLKNFRELKFSRLDWMLLLPFINPKMEK